MLELLVDPIGDGDADEEALDPTKPWPPGESLPVVTYSEPPPMPLDELCVSMSLSTFSIMRLMMLLHLRYCLSSKCINNREKTSPALSMVRPL